MRSFARQYRRIWTVTLGVRNGKKIGWNGSPVIDLKLVADVMPRRTKTRLIPVGKKLFHAIAVGMKNAPVARLRPRCLREPPHFVDRVLGTDAPHRHPLCRGRQFRWIPPVEVLGQLELIFFAQHDQELKVIEMAGRLSLVPDASNVDHKAP